MNNMVVFIVVVLGILLISTLAGIGIIYLCSYLYSRGEKKYGKEWVYMNKNNQIIFITVGSTIVVSTIMVLWIAFTGFIGTIL